MFTTSTALSRRNLLAAAGAAGLASIAAMADEQRRPAAGPSPTVPVAGEPPAAVAVDPPLPGPLARGVAVIPYRTANLRVLPVFGEAALAISPRVGHIHVTVDDAPWVWGVWHGTAGGELILAGLPAGPHKVLIELETPVHKPIARGVVEFEVPRTAAKVAGHRSAPRPTAEPAARLVVDPPDADALAGGLALIRYRAENAQLLPVYGPAAAAVTPRIGHVHITVDDAPWHWADATGQPVVVNGLPPGPHTITIELADADHRVLDGKVIKFDVPRR